MQMWCCFVIMGGLVLWTQATARATVHRQLDASGGPERLNIPQTLPDGVMVTTGEETRTTVATWTVLVTIDRPVILPQFRKRLEKLETLVPPQWTEPTLVPFQALWRERINQIRETWTQLQLPRDVAVSTDSGDLFVPQNCVGHQPAICVAGPLFSSQRYQCPRGVLTGDAQLRHTCQVTLRHRVANNTIIEEITPGQAVIVTRGEKLSLLCPREPERRSALTMGVYTLHLGPGCRAKGLGWTLLGPWSHDSKVVLIPPPLYIAPLNLSREVPPEVQRAHRLQQPAWTPLAPLENLPLIHLSEMPALGTGWTLHGCANAIVASVALLVASLSAFITCRATYWPQVRPAARRLIRRAKRRREDEAGPAPAPGGRLYPTLGPLMEESSGSAT